MGNCLTCFRSPTPMIQTSVIGTCHKDEVQGDLQLCSLYSTAAGAAQATSLARSPAVSPSPTTESNGNSHRLIGMVTVVNGAADVTSKFYQQRRSAPLTTTAAQDAKSCASDAKLTCLYEAYKDAHEDSILAEGIERLCCDLQLSPDEFRVLVLAWKLNAQQMCRFTRSEFVQGCREMRADSIRAMQVRLPEIVAELERDAELFKQLYRFTFRFGLDVAAGQRILPTDMAVCLWRLVFSVREPPILTRWLCFLQMNAHVRGIPRDTWNMFLNFAEAVGEDLSSYDDTEAWPSLFDDFVEYENDQMNQNISKAKESDSLLIKNDG